MAFKLLRSECSFPSSQPTPGYKILWFCTVCPFGDCFVLWQIDPSGAGNSSYLELQGLSRGRKFTLPLGRAFPPPKLLVYLGVRALLGLQIMANCAGLANPSFTSGILHQNSCTFPPKALLRINNCMTSFNQYTPKTKP
jgi:hypothetical protein